jgi:hypothetical protein
MNHLKYIFIFLFSYSFHTNAQQMPSMKIDNDTTYFSSDISFPYWLKAGQSLQSIQNVKNVSIIEFDVDSSGNMKFSRIVSGNLNTPSTVPAGKVWKMEAIGLKTSYTKSSNSQQVNDTSFQTMSGFSSQEVPTANSPKKFLYPGTYNWVAPPNVTRVCVEVWGAGGSGAIGNNPFCGGGGGGGGYGYQCFTVIPLTTYSVVVGAGLINNDGGTSSFGDLIITTGGKKGIGAGASHGLGGNGGTSTALYNYAGYNGSNGGTTGNTYSKGGNSGDNSGLGGQSGNNTNPTGQTPGGGGLGSNTNFNGSFGAGGDGRVIIYW